MIESWHETLGNDRDFQLFQDLIERQPGELRFAQVGTTLIIMGTVPTYAIKALIDAEAESQGLTIWNAVRVMPGREWSGIECLRVAS